MHSDRDAFSCECFLLGPCVDKGNSSTRARHGGLSHSIAIDAADQPIKKIPPQERSMGALSHSIAIDAADQPLIMYDEVVPRSIMNVHSQTTTGINCASIADRMVNWHDNQG